MVIVVCDIVVVVILLLLLFLMLIQEPSFKFGQNQGSTNCDFADIEFAVEGLWCCCWWCAESFFL